MELSLSGVRFEYPGGTFRLEVPEARFLPGRVTGLVGPNGAGKTTFLHLAAGLLIPSRGTVRVGEEPVETERTRGHVSFCPDTFPPRSRQSLGSWLRRLTRLRRRSTTGDEIVAAAERWGVHHVLQRSLDSLSRGQAQRAALALALTGAPRVVLLDEPAAWLDPDGREILRREVRRIREEGAVVVISSHDLAELDRNADEVLFFRAGKIVAVERFSVRDPREIELVVDGWPGAARERWPSARIVAKDGNSTTVRMRVEEGDAADGVADLVAALVELGVRIRRVGEPTGTLEEAWHEHRDA